jgi:hypothetical protein
MLLLHLVWTLSTGRVEPLQNGPPDKIKALDAPDRGNPLGSIASNRRVILC